MLHQVNEKYLQILHDNFHSNFPKFYTLTPFTPKLQNSITALQHSSNDMPNLFPEDWNQNKVTAQL
jgi:hypothetical protein